jgi:hypothetical protein
MDGSKLHNFVNVLMLLNCIPEDSQMVNFMLSTLSSIKKATALFKGKPYLPGSIALRSQREIPLLPDSCYKTTKH